MPRKKKNWELEYGNIHNNPEQFYYKFGDITLLSENLFQTPKIIKNRVLLEDVVIDLNQMNRRKRKAKSDVED